MAKSIERNQWHKVADGEDMPLIAKLAGFRNWRTIYDHQKNVEFRQKNPTPGILRMGDRLWIPEKTPKPPVFCEIAKEHRFQLKSLKSQLSIVLADDSGQPYAGTKYEIWIGGNRYGTAERQTTNQGIVQAEVPVVQEIELRVWFPDADEEQEDPDNELQDYTSITILPGHLDPIDTVDGVQDRLTNLGYDCKADPQGKFGEVTREALRSFQDACGLVPTGEIDELTSQHLVEKFGS